MEDEWEEEVKHFFNHKLKVSHLYSQEQLVVVELAGTLSNDFLTKNKNTCKVLDIDSENPFIQVGQFVFAGEYKDALGTCVLFEEQSRKGKDSAPELKYKCHTVKKLVMQRVFLTERKEAESSLGSKDTEKEGEDTAILLSDCDEEEGERLDDTRNSADMEESLMD